MESVEAPPIRGLKTVLVMDQEETTVRRYPSVLQPAQVTTLSFETAGRLGEINFRVGERVDKDQTLAELDPRTLEIQVESAEAAVAQAESSARKSADDFGRQDQLFKDGVTTRASVDAARTAMETSQAQVAQAQKQLESAQEALGKSVLRAPFDAIINTVQVDSYANVGAGTPVATIYSDENFETAFSVSYDVINRITVGKKVQVRLADNPEIILDAVVSELGSRADTVSSFPVVVSLAETRPELKAGMAVEVTVEFAVPRGEGYTLPLTVLSMDGSFDPPDRIGEPGEAFIYVYDAQTSTVKRRKIAIGGIRENSIIAVDGLEEGERVASAGVSFLRDGQEVKLLPDTE
jgi:RND family efflux transporter MFP subunit